MPLVRVFLRLRFGYRFQKPKELPDNYIVLSNHLTDWDPLFVGVSFNRQMYFVASEHILRWKLAGKLIHYFFQPIVRYKGTVAASTVVEVLRKTKAGCNVCIFAEGARCWDGITAPILPSTGKLIKSAKCGLVTYKLSGAYFVSPNWSEHNLRRGPISGAPVHVYTKEEIAAMSVDEINAIIARDLYENAYEAQLKQPGRYRCKAPAEQMENLLCVCPSCGALDTISSHGDTVSCSACGHSFRYTEYAMLEGTMCETVRELYAWQKKQLEKIAEEGTEISSPHGKLLTIDQHVETEVTQGPIRMNREILSCGDIEIPLSDISDLTMHGRHALVLTAGKTYYELLPDPQYNTLKYQLYYQACCGVTVK